MNAFRKLGYFALAILLLALQACQAGGSPPAMPTTTSWPNYAATGQALATKGAATEPPASPTATRAPTNTATPLPPTLTLTFTRTPRPTATIVVASDAQNVYDTVVDGCAAGVQYVIVGMVTIPCDDNVIPPPDNFNSAPSNVNVNLDPAPMTRCVTDGEMFAAHGFNKHGVKAVFTGQNIIWDSCKWNVQAVGIGVYYQPFLKGWEYTITEANGKVSVNKGPGGKWAYGATIRQLDAMTDPAEYWVHDDVVLMAREFNFGFGRDPRYGTVPGINLNLRGQWIQPDIKATCPINAIQATAILGGDDPKFWTAPDWNGGAWIFNSKGDGFHHLTHPGGPGWFDVWTAANGAISVYASDTVILETLNFEEASFHCSP